MDPGMLDREIEILQAIETRTDTGAVSRSWGALDSVWAHVSQVSAKEMLKGAADVSQSVLIFTIYYRDDVTVKHRVRYKDEDYDIVGVRELGYKEKLQLTGRLTK